MTISSYNINGIRSALKKGLANWIKDTKFNTYCFQELKASLDQIDKSIFDELGYYNYWFPAEKKGYSGVGIISNIEPENVVYGMDVDVYDMEGRCIRADFGSLSVISVYFPSGSSGDIRQNFKMSFLDAFLNYITDLSKNKKSLIICGDYNICHQPIDIHNPIRLKNTSGFLPEEREWVSKFLNSGYVDSFRHINPNQQTFSWWSYRARSRAKNLGWRIDYNMVSKTLENNIVDADILTDIIHSDHCPIYLKINS